MVLTLCLLVGLNTPGLSIGDRDPAGLGTVASGNFILFLFLWPIQLRLVRLNAAIIADGIDWVKSSSNVSQIV